jgi:hypothetical protein
MSSMQVLRVCMLQRLVKKSCSIFSLEQSLSRLQEAKRYGLSVFRVFATGGEFSGFVLQPGPGIHVNCRIYVASNGWLCSSPGGMRAACLDTCYQMSSAAAFVLLT